MSRCIAVLGNDPVAEADIPSLAYQTAFVEGQLIRQLRSEGRMVLAMPFESITQDDFSALAASGVSGVLLGYNAGARSDDAGSVGLEALRHCQRHGLPAVAYGDHPSLDGYHRVYSDHARGAELLVRYLHARGRRRILPFHPFPEQHSWLERRRVGYVRACRELALEPFDDVRSAVTLRERSAATKLREDYEHDTRAVAGYLAPYVFCDDPIDAIMTTTDGHAAYVATALRHLGKTPNRDVLIAGYDHVQAMWETRLEPVGPAVTIDRNTDMICTVMLDLLQRLIDSPVHDPIAQAVEPQLFDLASPA